MSTMNYLLYMKRETHILKKKKEKKSLSSLVNNIFSVYNTEASSPAASHLRSMSRKLLQTCYCTFFSLLLLVLLMYIFIPSSPTYTHYSTHTHTPIILCCNPFNFLCTAFRNRISFLDYTWRIICATPGITYFQMTH